MKYPILLLAVLLTTAAHGQTKVIQGCEVYPILGKAGNVLYYNKTDPSCRLPEGSDATVQKAPPVIVDPPTDPVDPPVDPVDPVEPVEPVEPTDPCEGNCGKGKGKGGGNGTGDEGRGNG